MLLRTNVSQAYWCSLPNASAQFVEAKFSDYDSQEASTISWFDKLFDGGILVPETDGKPLTMLIAGPPGSGKTTLAMELCYRLARNEHRVNGDNSMFSFYFSADAETRRVIDNAKRFNYYEADKYIVPFEEARPYRPPVDLAMVWGRDKIERWANMEDMLTYALDKLDSLAKHWTTVAPAAAVAEHIKKKFFRKGMPSEGVKAQPDILVVDSLNIVKPEEQNSFFTRFLQMCPSTKIAIFILDSASEGTTPKTWEYTCDIVLRLDYTSVRDYYVRTIEVVKARYQSHIWGRHQLKIYPASGEDMHASNMRGHPLLPSSQDERNGRMRRAHPYRREGGIFVYPSIHYYLSRYKRSGPTGTPVYADTLPKELSTSLGAGLPEGRCTAFIGGRGGHKSHLGYLHLLHRIVHGDGNEAALVISLRDDERMTRHTMAKILNQEFDAHAKHSLEECMSVLDKFEVENRLEVLYYHPGYITPEEFFHRMFISIHRLKNEGRPAGHPRKLTVLFNSLDQLQARFPLCAKQEIFVPGMIEALSGEGATSIFIAVDEKGQPVEQYGLLPMADLILSFELSQFTYADYVQCLTRQNILTADDPRLRSATDKSSREEIVLRVMRFSGGQRAGTRGLLELVEDKSTSFYLRAGLHYTPLTLPEAGSAKCGERTESVSGPFFQVADTSWGAPRR